MDFIKSNNKEIDSKILDFVNCCHVKMIFAIV